MNWIKDKKNLPKVLAVATFVIVIAGGLVAWELVANKSNAPAPVTSVATAPGGANPMRAPGAPSGYPGGPGGPPAGYPGAPGGPPAGYPGAPGGAAGAPGSPVAARRPGTPNMGRPGMAAVPRKPGATVKGMPGAFGSPQPMAGRTLPGGVPGPGIQVASKPPVNVGTGPDPFNLPKEYWIKNGRIRPPKKGGRDLNIPSLIIADVKALPPIDADLMPAAPASRTAKAAARTQNQSRRMAGVVFADNGVYAVLDTSGNTQMVQPGDRVNGGKIISIQSDGLTIRTDDDRDIKIPLASSTPGDTGNQPGGYPGYPGGPGGYPGGPGGYPGGPGGYPGGPGGYPGGPGGYPGGYPGAPGGAPGVIDNNG